MVLKPLGEKDISIGINGQIVVDESISQSKSYGFDVVAYDTFSHATYGSDDAVLWDPSNYNLHHPGMSLVEASINIDVNYTQRTWEIEDLNGNTIKAYGENSWEQTYTGEQNVLNRGYKFITGGYTQDDTYTADVNIRWEVSDPRYEITQN